MPKPPHKPEVRDEPIVAAYNSGSLRSVATLAERARLVASARATSGRPVHPGEVLRQDYLIPLNMSAAALAVALCVPATRIHAIVKERRSVTADSAARLAKYFGGDAASWLALQAQYDLKTLPTRQDIERQVAVRDVLAA